MKTECTSIGLEFQRHGGRRVRARFDGGRLTSDGGGLLLRETEARIGLLGRMASCFRDWRNPSDVEHTVQDLVCQRVYGLALGYEDLNDHNELRSDSALALLVGKSDITGMSRRRERDRGRPLASASALNRLELSRWDRAEVDRYRKIAADWGKLDRLLTDVFLELMTRRRRRSGWMWTRRTIRCTAIRRVASTTATTGRTAICRCTCSAASICCCRGCGHRTGTGARGRWER